MALLAPIVARFIPDSIPCPALLQPYQSLVAGVFVAYVPHFLRLLSTRDSKGAKSTYNNVDPTQTARLLADPTFAAFHRAHINTVESWPFFAAGVIAAMTSGVEKSAVASFSSAWVLLRAAYVFLYANQGNNEALGGLRSLSFFTSLVISCKLLWMSAKKSDEGGSA